MVQSNIHLQTLMDWLESLECNHLDLRIQECRQDGVKTAVSSDINERRRTSKKKSQRFGRFTFVPFGNRAKNKSDAIPIPASLPIVILLPFVSRMVTPFFTTLV